MKHALLTGGSGHRRLAVDGHQVMIHANSQSDAAENVADAIAGAGGSAQVLVINVADAGAVAAVQWRPN
jgi:3-oxoacyl-[acyl-carrier protein] reductase